MLGGLEVDAQRMAANLALTRGLVVAERLTLELTPLLGYDDARRVVEEASQKAVGSSISLEEALSMEPSAAGVLPQLPADVFDPAGWLGSSGGVRRPCPRLVPQGLPGWLTAISSRSGSATT